MSTLHLSLPSLITKAHPEKSPLTLGDLVAGCYRAWGKRKAEGMIRLAIKSHFIEFRGRQRFVIF